MRLAWMVDPHLVFLTPTERTPEDDLTPFLEQLAGQLFDALAISGDISEAPKLERHLQQLEEYVQRPIFFVLGNHDFYLGSFDEVLPIVEKLCDASPFLNCLEFRDWIDLTATTGLVGHGCWSDGRYGDFWSSPTILNDWRVIEDLRYWSEDLPPIATLRAKGQVTKQMKGIATSLDDLDRDSLLRDLHDLGDQAAAHISRVLPLALEQKDRVILITHVPPFLPATIPGWEVFDVWAPHSGCKVAGDAILQVMDDFPEKQLLILSGHLHKEIRFQVWDNIEQRIGFAEYLEPRIEEILEV